jgi:HD-GYP domain-containing protein (c-di-GMP phosphodiesterase class II)
MAVDLSTSTGTASAGLAPQTPGLSNQGRSNPANSNHGWPIKVSIASVVVTSMLLLAIAIIGIGWVGARESLLEAASRTARDAGLLITEKSHRMLEPAQATLRLLTSSSLATATRLDERLSGLQTLSDVIEANELISSVYVGYSDGSFFLVRALDLPQTRERFKAPPRSNFLVQSVEVGKGGKFTGEYLFFNADRELVERRPQPEYKFDPRTRPWYQSAQGTSSATFTQPYVFFSTQQVGLTLSQSSRDGNAIFGIDVVLDDLAANLSDLRSTPNAQIALVDKAGAVLAFPDMNRVLVKGDNRFDFKTIDQLGVPSLSALNALRIENGKVVPFDVAGEEWLGVVLPFNVWRAEGLRLLVASPSADLLGELRAKAFRLAVGVCLIAVLLMPVGWLAGAAIGRNMDRLTRLAQRMSQFDFRRTSMAPTLVREVNNLSSVMGEMGQTIETFLQISEDMAVEPRVERMVSNVLEKTVSATRCLGGVVYFYNAETQLMRQAARTGAVVGHDTEQLDGTQGVAPTTDAAALGSAVAELHMNLYGRSGSVEGILVLQHTADASHADASFLQFVRKLSGMLAVSIETRQLIDAQKKLLDAVIRLMADAIDAKSPYTGGHCERVPELAGMVIDAMALETTGPYASFTMSEDERYEFHLGAWLHDCGKVTSPEHIIDKSTKLETIYNRIHEVRMRFEVLWRDAHIDYWKALAEGTSGDVAEQARQTLEARKTTLQDDFAFVARSNVGGESMADADVDRLLAIGKTPWTTYFDNRLGLSGEELRRLLLMEPVAPDLPRSAQLLADRPDQVVPWGERKPPVEKGDPKNRYGFDMKLPPNAQNMGELHNLSIRRGTLTEEDRFKINDHIVQTLIMLRSLPWPRHLERVPDIAATHHEKLDGKGYPRQLRGDQLRLPDRVMALADVFEALTAADRPYKQPKTLTDSLRIMAFMAKDQHIDPAVFRYFLDSGIWKTFADKYMQPSQIDAVDIAAIHKFIPEAVV